jgi:hypothetical protein
LKRKNQIFSWIDSKCKPKLLADEIQEADNMRDLMEAFAEMTPEQMKEYYQSMSDEMEEEEDNQNHFEY